MSVFHIDPLQDPRWESFLQRQPGASVFHTPAWLEALQRTYGYEPVVFTTSAPGRELTDGIVFCRIRSWLTGHRLVSVPFSDHCEPLSDSSEDLQQLSHGLKEALDTERLRYIELRPVRISLDAWQDFGSTNVFWLHKLDLRRSLEELFHGLHKDCVQRKIRRAERESLSCEEGRSDVLLREFYHLLKLTRRRHQLPPPPLNWFRNLVDCLDETLTIRLARKSGQPVAAIMTIRYKDTLVYKYGCSDAARNRLGGTQLLLWRTIERAKGDGIVEFDLGRSDCDAAGLVTFKERLGGTRTALAYWRYPAPPRGQLPGAWRRRLPKRLFPLIPDSLLNATARLLYKHVG